MIVARYRYAYVRKLYRGRFIATLCSEDHICIEEILISGISTNFESISDEIDSEASINANILLNFERDPCKNRMSLIIEV